MDRADVQSQGVSALPARDAKKSQICRKQIRELQEQKNLRSSSVLPEAQPGVIPGRLGLLSKAPSQRMQYGTTEAARAKYPGAPEPSPVFRDQEQRPPAYSEPDKGIWDQSYLSKTLQQMKDSEMTKLKLPSKGYKPFRI